MQLTFRGKTITASRIVNFTGIVMRDLTQAMLLRLGVHKWKTQHAAYRQCRSLEGYFQLAGNNFELAQIKSEILAFLSFARQASPEHVCEIGTYEGGTNFLLSQALPTVKLMLGIDIHVRNSPLLRYFSRPDQELHFLNGSSRAPTTIENVAHILGSRKLDLLFIDGDHSYMSVKQDFLNFRQFVRDDGLIAFHDIVQDKSWRPGTSSVCKSGEVPRFWQELKPHYEAHGFIDRPEQDSYGIGVIRYSAAVALPEQWLEES